MSKYLKVLTNNETYDAWTNGGIPHVALKEDTDELFYQSDSPLLSGITLIDYMLGDTKESGKLVYNYLFKQCGNGKNGVTYKLKPKELLYCTYDSHPSPSVTNEETIQISTAVYEEFLVVNTLIKAIRLYPSDIMTLRPEDTLNSVIFSLTENGSLIAE
jgi:hypothetical protein